MNESILSPYTIITVSSFLVIFVMVAFFIRKKSGSLKKIINKKINIIEYSSVRGGYSAIIFSVENEKFFFVGHKSGNSNLVQILGSPEEKTQKFTNNLNEVSKNKEINNTLIQKENENVSSKTESKKPLEQVNISDLLALHKKG